MDKNISSHPGGIFSLLKAPSKPGWLTSSAHIEGRLIFYLTAFFLVVISIIANWLLIGYLPRGSFFLPLAAVTISAFIGGFGPGIFATFLATVSMNYLFLETSMGLTAEGTQDWVRLIAFASACTFISYFGSTYRNALKKADISRNIAEQAKAAHDYYLAIVSHDLKTPLTSIILKLELMMRGGPDAQNISGIYDNANQLKTMIDSLLDLSKLDSRQFALNSRDQNVRHLLDKVREILEPIAQKNQITLRISSSSSDRIYCDEGAMVRVLVNLVSNAIKFTPQGGSVSLISQQHLDRVIIEVSDTGVGISPENIPHVFDRYWQAKATARQGSGLGLAIVKGLVEAHGGKVWAESRIGHGSRFFVSMPREKVCS